MEHVQQESKLWLKGKWAALHLLEQSCCQYSVAGCRFHFDDFIVYLFNTGHSLGILSFWFPDEYSGAQQRMRPL